MLALITAAGLSVGLALLCLFNTPSRRKYRALLRERRRLKRRYDRRARDAEGYHDANETVQLCDELTDWKRRVGEHPQGRELLRRERDRLNALLERNGLRPLE